MALTVPLAGAARAFSIFMASRITTVSPSADRVAHILFVLDDHAGHGRGQRGAVCVGSRRRCRALRPALGCCGGRCRRRCSGGAAGGAAAGQRRGAEPRRQLQGRRTNLDLLDAYFKMGLPPTSSTPTSKYSLSTNTLKVRVFALGRGVLFSFPPVRRPWLF
jgi:hypothetical protein